MTIIKSDLRCILSSSLGLVVMVCRNVTRESENSQKSDIYTLDFLLLRMTLQDRKYCMDRK